MDLLKNALLSLLGLGVILGTGYAVYQYGYNNGSRDVRLEWAEDKVRSNTAHEELVAELARHEEQHRMQQEEIANDLAQVRQQHETALARERAVHQQRLVQSSRRAEVYQRQAEADAAARRDLASHAARLDRALEEGLELVGELTATLGLRDHQLILLGGQIRNDRQLLESETP